MNHSTVITPPDLEERLAIHREAQNSVCQLVDDTRLKAELLGVLQGSMSNTETMTAITNFLHANVEISDECIHSLNALYKLCNSNLAGPTF